MTVKLPGGHVYLHGLPPTPLVPVQLESAGPRIWAKLEFLNPSGSTKDRIARHILGKAWREGRVYAGCTVIEASSGSTSIAMALTCAQFGLKFIAVMPEGVSNERVLMIRALGGEIRLTSRERGIRGSIEETQRLAGELNAFLPRQFSNPENAEAHALATAREILDQMPGGTVDAVVSGVGTGGTLVGLWRGTREAGCDPVPVLARPVEIGAGESPEMECCSFSCRIPGVVESISSIFEPGAMDRLMTVEVRDDTALEVTRELMRRGFPVGASSGLNCAAAMEAAERLGPGAQVVTVFPDRMERYFTTDLFKPMRV